MIIVTVPVAHISLVFLTEINRPTLPAPSSEAGRKEKRVGAQLDLPLLFAIV